MAVAYRTRFPSKAVPSEQPAGAARFATCPAGARAAPPHKTAEKQAFPRATNFCGKSIRHAGRRRVLFWCRSDRRRPDTEHTRFSSAAVPPPKDPHLDSRSRARGFPNHGPFSIHTPAGPSMAPAGLRGCGASQGCPEPRAVAPPGDRGEGSANARGALGRRGPRDETFAAPKPPLCQNGTRSTGGSRVDAARGSARARGPSAADDARGCAWPAPRFRSPRPRSARSTRAPRSRRRRP